MPTGRLQISKVRGIQKALSRLPYRCFIHSGILRDFLFRQDYSTSFDPVRSRGRNPVLSVVISTFPLNIDSLAGQ